jgi:hypothetical protein
VPPIAVAAVPGRSATADALGTVKADNAAANALRPAEPGAPTVHSLGTAQVCNSAASACGSAESFDGKSRFLRQHPLVNGLDETLRLILKHGDLREWLLYDLASPMPRGEGFKALLLELGSHLSSTDVSEAVEGFVRMLASSYAEDRTVFEAEARRLATAQWPARAKQTLALCPSWVARWHDKVALVSSRTPQLSSRSRSSVSGASASLPTQPSIVNDSSSSKRVIATSTSATDSGRRSTQPSGKIPSVDDVGETVRQNVDRSEEPVKASAPSSRRPSLVRPNLDTLAERSAKRPRLTPDASTPEAQLPSESSAPSSRPAFSHSSPLKTAGRRPSLRQDTTSPTAGRCAPRTQSGSSPAAHCSTASPSRSSSTLALGTIAAASSSRAGTVPGSFPRDTPPSQAPQTPIPHAQESPDVRRAGSSSAHSDVAASNKRSLMSEVIRRAEKMPEKLERDSPAWPCYWALYCVSEFPSDARASCARRAASLLKDLLLLR